MRHFCWHLFVSALFLIFSMACYWGVVAFSGFPDGHRTDLAQGREVLAEIAIFISVLSGLYFLFQGLFGSDKHGRGHARHSVVMLVGVVAVFLVIYSFLGLYLDDGAGG